MENQYSDQKQPRPATQDASLKEKIEDNSKWSARVSGNYLLTGIQIWILLWLFPESPLRQRIIDITSTKKDTVFVPVPVKDPINHVVARRKPIRERKSAVAPAVKSDTTIIVVQAPAQQDNTPTFLVLAADDRKYVFRKSNQVGDSTIYEAVPLIGDSTVVAHDAAPNTTIIKSVRRNLVTQLKANVPRSKIRTVHRVGRGDILRVVAAKYGITLNALMKANGLKRNYITRGSLLIIPYP